MTVAARRIHLVAIQLAVDPRVLASPDAYRRHLEDCAAAALADLPAHDPAHEPTLVVFPEIAGHLALYALAPASTRRARTLGGALAAAALRRPLDVLRGAAQARRLDPRHAVLAALAPAGELWWKSVFAPLARRANAYVVAGSYLRLGAGGELTNASLLYGPDGRLLATTDKVNLVPGIEDAARGGLALARGDAGALPIVDTALGRVATLVCYDGFMIAHTAHERFVAVGPRLAARGGVDVVANPAANPWPWHARWPFDDRIRADQWQAEGLPATLAATSCARYGVTAHLVGRVLDLAFDGVSEIVERGDDGRVHQLAAASAHDRGGHVVASPARASSATPAARAGDPG